MKGKEGTKEGKKQTIIMPRNRTRPQPARSILVNLEPDRSLAVKGGSRLSRGNLGHVKVQGAGVADGGVDGKSVVGSGGHGQSLGRSRARVELVAGHG